MCAYMFLALSKQKHAYVHTLKITFISFSSFFIRGMDFKTTHLR